ncbi:MAG: hypothetical protein K9M57_04665 [Phycisphaerae bacterium]|nr:hypothetical protein [Phycisphaerae bacterium]
MRKRLEILRDYFPTAVYTGRAIVFISEETRVELTEHTHGSLVLSNGVSTIRVRLFSKEASGEFVQGHYEDFELEDISDLAGEIEKFVQFAVGKNIKE